MQKTKKKLLLSVLSLVLCFALLAGTTFAWFTDSVTSANNIITSGNLDIEMYWTDDLASDVWYNVEDAQYNTIFSYDNWEPGYTDVKYIKLVNAGSLAINYQLLLTPQTAVGKLAEVINVFYANDGVEVATRADLDNLNALGLLSNVLTNKVTANGTLLAKNQISLLHPTQEVVVTVAMEMLTTAGNEYQLQEAGDFTITALATQCPFEEDAFGSDYDVRAAYEKLLSYHQITTAVTAENGKIANKTEMSAGGVTATIPAGVAVEDGTTELTLTINPLDSSATNITTVNNEVLLPVDVHIEGVAADNTTPIEIALGNVLPKGLNAGNYNLIHVDNGTNVVMTYVAWDQPFTGANQFKYDAATGAVIVSMATFSEVALLVDADNVWKGTVATGFAGGNGTEASPYLINNVDQFVYFAQQASYDDHIASAHYKLTADLNFGGQQNAESGTSKECVYYPVGYWKRGEGTNAAGEEVWYKFGKAFTGVFDGQGHTIKNIYQQTWLMDGNYDYGYYKAAMGIFGDVVGGTVKNLNVENFVSVGEFAPTGCVAAFAAGNALFENIKLINCHPSTYNTGVAGIVGWDDGGDTPEEASNITFKDIDIDNSNMISALWGSWDVAAAGLMGYLGTYSKANIIDCRIGATIDIYNDVCGNYQYYWHRYCGMVIGTVDRTKADGSLDLSNITATNTLVSFGGRHDNYYCELVANSLASYTHDHQFSRLTTVDSVNPNNMTYVLKGQTYSIPASGRYNYVVVNKKDAEGNYIHGDDSATCYHFVDGKVWNHEDAGTEVINGQTILKEDRQHYYIPFRQLFGGYGWGVDGVDEYAGIQISEIDFGGTGSADDDIINGDDLWN